MARKRYTPVDLVAPPVPVLSFARPVGAVAACARWKAADADVLAAAARGTAPVICDAWELG